MFEAIATTTSERKIYVVAGAAFQDGDDVFDIEGVGRKVFGSVAIFA